MQTDMHTSKHAHRQSNHAAQAAATACMCMHTYIVSIAMCAQSMHSTSSTSVMASISQVIGDGAEVSQDQQSEHGNEEDLNEQFLMFENFIEDQKEQHLDPSDAEIIAGLLKAVQALDSEVGLWKDKHKEALKSAHFWKDKCMERVSKTCPECMKAKSTSQESHGCMKAKSTSQEMPLDIDDGANRCSNMQKTSCSALSSHHDLLACGLQVPPIPAADGDEKQKSSYQKKGLQQFKPSVMAPLMPIGADPNWLSDKSLLRSSSMLQM